MSRGRCSGCGKEDASCKKIRSHVNSCPEFIALFKSSPDLCLDPEDEYKLHSAHSKSEEAIEAKDALRQEKHEGYRQSNNVRIEAARERFSGGTKFSRLNSIPTEAQTPEDGTIRSTARKDDPARRVAESWGTRFDGDGLTHVGPHTV